MTTRNHPLRTRLILIAAAIATAAVLACSLAHGQEPEPDRRGEVALRSDTYKGTHANAPIPPNLHIRNEGGSNLAGLCVIAAAIINGNYQHVPGIFDRPNANGEPGKGSILWQTAKKRPGGYGPDKLERLLREVMPDEKWISYYGSSPEVLEELSSKGYPIGATMNTGQLYHYMPIAHMISLVHFQKDGLACVVDNNDPGVFHWMPAEEFVRRWYSGGAGWAFAWSRLPPRVRIVAVSAMLAAAALLLLAAALLVAGGGVVVLSQSE